MKIGISANTSWNLINFRLNLMKDLRNEGYEVIAIAPEDDSTSKIIMEGFRFIPLHSLSRKGSNPIKDLQLIKEYQSIYTRERFDAILLYTIKPVIYGNLAKIGSNVYSIATITGLGYTFLNNGIRPLIAKRLYKVALKYCNHIFFQNEDDKLLFEKENILEAEVAKIINGSGIDTKAIFPKQNLKLNKDIDLLFVGRILVDKGIKELLIAFRKLCEKRNNVNLIIVGGLDTENPSIVNLSEFENLCNHPKIRYLGERTDVLDIIQESDIVVLPSYREGIPRVLLEAMSLSKPIVATNVPGCRQVLNNGINGIMCESRSSESLFKALIEMIELSKKERDEMGLMGRQMAIELFDHSIISKNYINIIRNII